MRGDFSCTHRDLPLTLALSQGRGKVRSARKSRKLILPPSPRAIMASVFGMGGTGPVTCARKLAEPVRVRG
ncbi:MAG: hypothetical protein ACJA0K_001542 [Maricaulis maris]|jgi:hypothetical protein